MAARTAPLYDTRPLRDPRLRVAGFAPYIAAINGSKRERNAVILAHNYQTPEIFHGVADFVGDSLALASEAAKTDAEVIVLAGVHFMAETAKILTPEKTVLIPDLAAGCSLAASITGADVRLLRAALPGRAGGHLRQHLGRGEGRVGHLLHLGQRREVVEALGVRRVIFLPDEFLAQNVASQTKVEIIAWQGHCEVHERFTGAEIRGSARAIPASWCWPTRMPARRAGRGRLRRLDGGDDRLRRRKRPAARRADHRMLDERQRRRRAIPTSSSCGPAISART